MNAIFNAIEAAEEEGDLPLARNELLNVFSDLEVAVTKILRSCGIEPSAGPFSNRVQDFRRAERTSLIAKANLPRRDILADRISALLPVRADIVHSRLKRCVLDGEAAALFINSQEAVSKYPKGRVITLRQLHQISNEISELCSEIAQLNRVNPPSSPQPPSPGAAGDL